VINQYDQALAMIYQAERTLSEATLDHGFRTVVYELQRAVFDRNQAEREDWDTWYY
jgi:hypothetical protein